jgi:ribosome biogenesis GTPase
MTDLGDFGWDPAREAEFGPFRAAGLVPARVSLEHNHVYRVLAAGGERLAETAGRLKHRASGRRELPAVGDWVAIRLDERGHGSTIRAVLSRRSVFSRKAAGRPTDEQVVAANVDAVLIVFGLDKPVNARAIERYLAMVRRSGAEPVIVLNKSDVAEDLGAAINEAEPAARRGHPQDR